MSDSNTFRDRTKSRLAPLCTTLAFLTAICLTDSAKALDPNKAISQYIRDDWNSSNGFPGGQVHSIAQTPDGYLWLAASKGLFRYDGLAFLPFHPPDPAALNVTRPIQLATDGAGDLWVTDEILNAQRYHNDRFEDLVSTADQPEKRATAISRDSRGRILLSILRPRILRINDGKIETLVEPPILHGGVVLSVAETTDGKIWMGTRDEGLSFVDRGQLTVLRDDIPDRKINCLLPAEKGTLWIGTDNGLAYWDGTNISPKRIPAALSRLPILALVEDRDANLWIGTTAGLFRLSPDGVPALEEGRSRQNAPVTALFEDREGNLWVGDSSGVERIRDSAFSTYSTGEGLPSESSGPIYIDAAGRAWVAPSDGGLYRINHGKADRVAAGLGSDVVYSIAGDKDDLWIGRRLGGLTHLFLRNGAGQSETFTHADGLAQNSVSSVFKSADGAIWAGTLSGGVSRLKDGRFTTFTAANGLGSNTISSIAQGLGGAMWFATSGGLSEFSNGLWRNYTMQDGLPSDEVITLLADPFGVLWIGTANGLAFGDSNRIQRAGPTQGPLREPVLGIAADRSGSLWVATSNHVLQASRNALLNGQPGGSSLREYGISDGLHGTEGVRRDRSVVSDSHGRIWFSMSRGVSVIDPGRTSNKLAQPIALVEEVEVDGNRLAPRAPVKVPALPQRIKISYIGLSLAIPERVRYRYKLEGFDREWSESVGTRQVVYTNLGPGWYRFHVTASTSDGDWNGAEATLPFRIEPAVWQTWWFLSSGVLSVILAAWLFYYLRMRQITKQLNLRFDERLAERMRIAQELHDTLLQGVISASMQLHLAVDMVPENSAARVLLGSVLQLMGQVTEEGRTTLRGIRSAGSERHDLERAFSSVPEDLALGADAAYRVVVDGLARPLHPAVRDEVYRIGREALVNAFRHAQATSIELQMEYTPGHLRVVVRDNGCGIDPEVLITGREGHWGMAGMRERAKAIGGKFRVFSRPTAGTEVELTVPAHVAFQQLTRNRLWQGFRSLVSNAGIQRPRGDRNL